MTYFLEAWDENDKNIEVMTTQTRKKIEPKHKDPLKILAIRINLVNAADQDQFVSSTQFNIEKLETHAHTMQGLNAAK